MLEITNFPFILFLNSECFRKIKHLGLPRHVSPQNGCFWYIVLLCVPRVIPKGTRHSLPGCQTMPTVMSSPNCKVWGNNHHKNFLSSNTSTKLEIPMATFMSDQLTINTRLLVTTLRLDSFLEWFTELKKMLNLWLAIIGVKGCKLDAPKGRENEWHLGEF